MKWKIIGVLVAGVATLGAAPPSCNGPQSFANCTEMHGVYIGGVGYPGAIDQRSGGGAARYAPYYDAATYQANSSLDRDGDGIACEQ